eukprot:630352-Pyramimonas_sp.AAC.2
MATEEEEEVEDGIGQNLAKAAPPIIVRKLSRKIISGGFSVYGIGALLGPRVKTCWFGGASARNNSGGLTVGLRPLAGS